jgi:DNA invertase Pin-like site-specific DNA recombinase
VRKADQNSAPRDCISYVSGSTKHHGKGGLGIRAQQVAIRSFCKAERLNIVEEFVEEGNILARRPKLKAALAAALKIKDPDYGYAPIIVAKLDRLSHDVRFISQLMAYKVPFVTIEVGLNVQPKMLHVYPTFATHQYRSPSQRNDEQAKGSARAKARKEQGVVGKNAQSLKSKAEAIEFAESLRPVIAKIKEETGKVSPSAICEVLNAWHIKTSNGGRWYPQTTTRLLERLGRSDPPP